MSTCTCLRFVPSDHLVPFTERLRHHLPG